MSVASVEIKALEFHSHCNNKLICVIRRTMTFVMRLGCNNPFHTVEGQEFFNVTQCPLLLLQGMWDYRLSESKRLTGRLLFLSKFSVHLHF